MPFNTKTIDQLSATSATTVDLAADSYQTTSGLRTRVLSKANALEGYPAGPKVLRLGVPDDVIPTRIQTQTIERLTYELGLKGIKLVIVPIN